MMAYGRAESASRVLLTGQPRAGAPLGEPCTLRSLAPGHNAHLGYALPLTGLLPRHLTAVQRHVEEVCIKAGDRWSPRSSVEQTLCGRSLRYPGHTTRRCLLSAPTIYLLLAIGIHHLTLVHPGQVCASSFVVFIICKDEGNSSNTTCPGS
jgi:hypothetical protein